MKPYTVEEVLHDAKELIKKEGWMQYVYEQDGHFCAVGAIVKSISVHNDKPTLYPQPGCLRMDEYELFIEASKLLRSQWISWLGWNEQNFLELQDLNDDERTTVDEVLYAFELAEYEAYKRAI